MPAPDFAHGLTGTFYIMADRQPWPHAAKTAVASANPGATPPADPAAPSTGAQASAAGNLSFGDLLDVVNPLQHLPVVGTLYRAVSGDQIGDPEKVIGDTIYGGPLGLVSSLADLAFKHITGKDFGSTVLAFVTGEDDAKPVAVAAAKPSQTQPAPAASASLPATTRPPKSIAALPSSPANGASPVSPQIMPTPDLAALTAALKRSGIDAGTSARAALAYQQSMVLAGVGNPATAH